KTNSNLTDEQFEQKLKQQLVVLSQTRAQWEQQNIDQAMIQSILEHEWKINVTGADGKKYYTENMSKVETPEMVRPAHILIATRDLMSGTEMTETQKAEKKKLAEDLLKRARAGEDFAKLARQYTDDTGSKEKGGEYTFGRGQMQPPFENAAFALKPNEVSDLVT